MDLRKIVGPRPLIACGAAVAIINQNNQLLLQHRADNNCWGLVGGMLELGETIEEAAIREVYEEVGLALTSLDFFKVYSGPDYYYQYPNGDEVYNVVNMFTARGNYEQLTIDHNEVKAARFFNLNELPKNISPPDAQIVKDVTAYFLN